MPVRVRGLALTAVKGTRLRAVDSIALDESGVRDNRRFYLIDPDGVMVNALRLGALQTVVAEYSEPGRQLRLGFSDGRVLEDEVRHGPEVTTEFYGEPTRAILVEGPWSDALSELVDRPLRLVEAPDGGAVDRGARGAVSLISRASLERLAAEGGLGAIDGRRFRMLIEVDGLAAHEEDRWVGSSVALGEAKVRLEGHVGRCAITTRNPETGDVDIPTLKLIGRYRRDLGTTEPIPFGVYGRVLEPGTIRVGDPVAVDR
jgi:MOSC domain-containing protein